MKKYMSKLDPTLTCHIVFRSEDMLGERTEIVEPNQYIQCAALKLSDQKMFRAHQHVWKPGSPVVIAQESWCVIKGKVQVYFYDIDETFLDCALLNPGDISVTLHGGHNYQSFGESIVYEYKTGPYTGQSNDKKFLAGTENCFEQRKSLKKDTK